MYNQLYQQHFPLYLLASVVLTDATEIAKALSEREFGRTFRIEGTVTFPSDQTSTFFSLLDGKGFGVALNDGTGNPGGYLRSGYRVLAEGSIDTNSYGMAYARCPKISIIEKASPPAPILTTASELQGGTHDGRLVRIRGIVREVFMDEIDSLCTSRSQGGDATSRAILGVMLAEMDGMQKKSSDPRASFVLTVAATNTPWSLDPALLSRFGENRVLVPAPDASGRRAILEKMIVRQGYKLQEASDLDWLAEDAQTAGYSGRDLRSLTSVAKRRMEMEMNPDLSNWKDLKEVSGREVKLRPLSHDDFLAARTRVPPSITPQVMDDFRRWCDDPNCQPKGVV